MVDPICASGACSFYKLNWAGVVYVILLRFRVYIKLNDDFFFNFLRL